MSIVPPAGDRAGTLLIGALTLTGSALLLWPLLVVFTNGLPVLDVAFLTTSPADAGRSGGVASILVSTLAIVLTSLAAALPLAFGIAVVLTEVCVPDGWPARTIRSSLDVLAGIPSVVFGLFGLSLFCRTLGLGYSIAAGGLTLACMILPTMARAFYSAIEAAGAPHRSGGAALGLSRRVILTHLIVPLALPGLCAGVILAMTRALAETALLLFTSGYSDRMPESITDSGRSISVHIYDLSTNVPGGMPNAYGSALALLLLLALLSTSVHATTRWMHTRMTGVKPIVVKE